MTFFNVLHNGAKNDELITFLRLEIGGEWIFVFFGVKNDSTEEFSKFKWKHSWSSFMSICQYLFISYLSVSSLQYVAWILWREERFLKENEFFDFSGTERVKQNQFKN